ncbi:hypothetical protein QVA66_04755 [Staphylococcus chromogenes]|nr:hypothetical protein [Staphylococcus chromogenes]
MDTSNWFSSRKNVVGMVLASIAVIVHLIAGLGAFWPVIALAAYGLGVVLTPSAQPPVALPTSETYSEAVGSSAERFSALGVGESSKLHLGKLQWTIQELEKHVDELAAQPILLQTVSEISYSHLPSLESAYAEVPDLARKHAGKRLDSSLALLNQEATKILNAIVEQKFKGLEDQRSMLEERFSGVQLYLSGGASSTSTGVGQPQPKGS